MKYTPQDYKSVIKPVWCPGCGDFGVLSALQRALSNLEIPPENIVSVSGIGCSGRFPHFMNTYSLHGTHGRALPTALGVKAVRPELCVIVAGGDGDGLGIGGGHLPHAARKNVDLTYILMDNQVYGLTKGQSSPTTPVGRKTKTSPYGAFEEVMDSIPVLLAYDVSFVARETSLNINQLINTIMEAIKHRGMSMVYTLSPCRTFPSFDEKALKESIQPLPADHPRENKLVAMERAYSTQPLYTGIFYQKRKPTLDERLEQEIQKSTKTLNKGQLMSSEQVLQLFA